MEHVPGLKILEVSSEVLLRENHSACLFKSFVVVRQQPQQEAASSGGGIGAEFFVIEVITVDYTCGLILAIQNVDFVCELFNDNDCCVDMLTIDFFKNLPQIQRLHQQFHVD